MKKAITTQLRKLAQELPPLGSSQERRALGSELLKVGYESTKERPIDPDKVYIANMPIVVNHYDRLKEAYKAEGKLGIAKYQKWVNAVVLLSQRQEELSQDVSTQPKAEPAGSYVPADETEERA